jgi:hypothetical protein
LREPNTVFSTLKGHGNEADFLEFSWKLSGESAFECLKENSASQRVFDSLTQGVAMVSQGVAFQIFSNLASIFQTLNGYTSPLKDQFGKKEAQGCNLLSPLIYLKV